MKAREQNRNEKRTEIERFDWFIERTVKRAWLFIVKRTLRWKNFMPENFLEINRYFALTSYYNTIGQSNNAFSILGFLWRENKEAMFWSFHPLADETKNEHLPKPFFKVIRKSLYTCQLSRIMSESHACGLKILGTLRSNNATATRTSLKKVYLRSFGLYKDYSYLNTLSNVGEPSWSWISRNHIEAQKEKYNSVVACLRPP